MKGVGPHFFAPPPSETTLLSEIQITKGCKNQNVVDQDRHKSMKYVGSAPSYKE